MERKVKMTVSGVSLSMLLSKTKTLFARVRNIFASSSGKDSGSITTTHAPATFNNSRERDYGVREDCAVHGDDRPKAPTTTNRKTKKNKPPRK